MEKEPSHAPEPASEDSFRVIDNLPADLAVSAAELDAVEAFLMPLVNELFSGAISDSKEQADSEAPQRSAR
jgi:hypothetical protein